MRGRLKEWRDTSPSKTNRDYYKSTKLNVVIALRAPTATNDKKRQTKD